MPNGNQAFAAIPAELRAMRRWMLWRSAKRKGKGKITKIPFQPSGAPAKSTDPKTWSTFNVVADALRAGGFSGIGFALGDGIAGVDLDDAINDAGNPEPWALEIVQQLKSYTEISPSGRGLHVIVRGKLPPKRRRKGRVEMYDSGRYFCMTGNAIPGSANTVEERTAELAHIHALSFGSTPHTKVSASLSEAVVPNNIDATIAAAIVNVPEFAATWNRKRDFSDQSASCYDMALANFCVRLGLGEGQFQQMSRRWREKHNDDPAKADRPDYIRTTWQKAVTSGNGRHTTAASSAVAAAVPGSEAAVPFDHLTDIGNAARIARENKNRLRFLYGPGYWLVWDGKRWKPDDDGSVVKLAVATVLKIHDEAKRLPFGDDARAKLIAHATRSERKERIIAMIDLAKPELAAQPDVMDADPFLFNVSNGTIELRTGQLRAHDPSDRITKLAPVTFDPDAAAPLFMRFLDRIFAGDADLIGYIQRVLGMALTGDVREQHLWILWGEGANGKNTLLDSVCGLMGDYAGQTPPHLLTSSKQREHPTEIADLMGRRLAVAAETEDDAPLRLQLVKILTGNARIKARVMRGDYFEFPRTHKLILMTNNRPSVREDTEAAWRRLRLIPCRVVIPECERDSLLLTKLRTEWPGILAWLVRGCLDWQAGGLHDPAAVVDATRNYRGSRNHLAGFIGDRCVRDAEAWAESRQLFGAYVDWCKHHNHRPMSETAFGTGLGNMDFEAEKQGGKRGRSGLRIKPALDKSDGLDR